eukprot:scaffold2987_cov170-Amphora_coffeaeformis.AAC.9
MAMLSILRGLLGGSRIRVGCGGAPMGREKLPMPSDGTPSWMVLGDLRSEGDDMISPIPGMITRAVSGFMAMLLYVLLGDSTTRGGGGVVSTGRDKLPMPSKGIPWAIVLGDLSSEGEGKLSPSPW